jgi:hypothetical protein
MPKKLNDRDNIAHQIVNIICDGKRKDDAVPACMEVLDIALSHDDLDVLVRAQIIGKICWRFGLEPPDDVIRMLMS